MSSGAAVSNPAEWHIYPAGAHHKLTECGPALHSMIEQHRFDLQLPDPNEFEPGYVDTTHQWVVKPDTRPGRSGLWWTPVNAYEAWQDGWTKATHAAADDLDNMRARLNEQQEKHNAQLKRATDRAYLDGVRVGVENGIAEGLQQAAAHAAKAEKMREYWTTGPGSVRMSAGSNEHPPAMNEAQAGSPPAASTPQAPHKCARAMLIVHNDGAETTVSFDHPIAQRGWKFCHINGVPILVIGHGVPRRHIPLANVKFMDLLTEDEL